MTVDIMMSLVTIQNLHLRSDVKFPEDHDANPSMLSPAVSIPRIHQAVLLGVEPTT